MSHTDKPTTTCIMYTCNTHNHIVMSLCMAIILTLIMFIFAMLNSCFSHDDYTMYMINCLMYCNDCSIIPNAPINPIVYPIQVGSHNKITHGCIYTSSTVQKDHENIYINVLDHSTCQSIAYLLNNNNPMLKLLNIRSFSSNPGLKASKIIKNHGFTGLTLKTDVFNAIFSFDLVSKMSTKSCARTLKNTCFSDITQPQKTALKTNFSNSVIQILLQKHLTHLPNFLNIKKLPLFTAHLCHNSSVFKTMNFLESFGKAPPLIMVNLTQLNIHVFISCFASN